MESVASVVPACLALPVPCPSRPLPLLTTQRHNVSTTVQCDRFVNCDSSVQFTSDHSSTYVLRVVIVTVLTDITTTRCCTKCLEAEHDECLNEVK